jgi:hypothetical protein
MNKPIILCCGTKGCPQVSLDGNKVKIKFDSGNTEEMELGQAEMIAGALDELKKSVKSTESGN